MKNNKKRGNPGIEMRNITISVLAVTFILGVLMILYTMLSRQTRERIIYQGEVRAEKAASQIDGYLANGFDTIEVVSYTLNDMISDGAPQETIHEYLVSQTDAIMNTTVPYTTGLYGYINGIYEDGTDWVPDSDYVATERPWYTSALEESDHIAVVEPYVDAQTRTVMITFARVLCDGESVAAMDYNIDPIQMIEENAGGLEMLLDENYLVIAHSNLDEVGRNYAEETGTMGSAVTKALMSKEEDYFSVKFGGNEYIVYSVPISNGWYCLSVSDASSAFRPVRYTLIFTVVSVLIICAILIVIMLRSRKRQVRFSQLSIQVVEALAAAIDAKDTNTNGHSGRVAEYAEAIAERYGYNEKQLAEIYMMGLLHDVGKIGIPDSVIKKPGHLTDEEYDLIKTHPVKGVKILEKTKEMPRLTVGAHWHHERYDGRGYPDGLSGTDIPEEARIIAVADAYDAMTSSRSYRNPLPADVVRDEIEKGKGAQFDPEFADIMLDIIDDENKQS